MVLSHQSSSSMAQRSHFNLFVAGELPKRSVLTRCVFPPFITFLVESVAMAALWSNFAMKVAYAELMHPTSDSVTWILSSLLRTRRVVDSFAPVSACTGVEGLCLLAHDVSSSRSGTWQSGPRLSPMDKG